MGEFNFFGKRDFVRSNCKIESNILFYGVQYTSIQLVKIIVFQAKL